MIQKLKVYLAGAIDRDNPWRAKVIEECQDANIEFLCPIDDVLYSHQSLSKHHKSDKVFHIADELKVDWANVLFAYFQHGSKSYFSGTSYECGYARKGGKKIIIVMDMKPDKCHKHELAKRTCDCLCLTLDEGIDQLRRLGISMAYQSKKED